MSESLIAVFADVHANLEALEAVLADMDSLSSGNGSAWETSSATRRVLRQCLERVRSLGCPTVRAITTPPRRQRTICCLDDMRDVARSGIEFARRKLSPEQRAWLAGLPLVVFERGAAEFVHASLCEPAEWRYIMREPDARDHFAAQSQPLSFCGHTHAPMVWHLSNTGNIKPWRGCGRIELPMGGKTLINVGSVGQPRDLCPEACYAVVEPRGGLGRVPSCHLRHRQSTPENHAGKASSLRRPAAFAGAMRAEAWIDLKPGGRIVNREW